MNNKYIIKNCDCILSSGRCNVKSLVYCQDCTDCKMKQIVEKCKNNQKLKWQVGEEPEQWISFNNPSSYQVLQLLDIREVETNE